MFIGGAPGSVAGGIKITTIFILFFVIFKKPDIDGDINIMRHRITRATIYKATVYLIKAIALLFIFILLFLMAEQKRADAIIFEIISAYSTVGFCLDVELSKSAQWLMILAMFFGRIGLVALAFPHVRHKTYNITYPQGNLLL
jgi:trk system potassium uptake protein TrkH